MSSLPSESLSPPRKLTGEHLSSVTITFSSDSKPTFLTWNQYRMASPKRATVGVAVFTISIAGRRSSKVTVASSVAEAGCLVGQVPVAETTLVWGVSESEARVLVNVQV